MSVKSVIPWALLLAVLGTSRIQAQDYLRARESPDVPSATQAPLLPELPQPVALPPVTGPDNYITYRQPCCCGPVGGDGPITWELFVRTGPTMPITGTFINHFMVDGWMVQGGGRTLFYNVDRNAAWTLELGLSHDVNQGKDNMWLSHRQRGVPGGREFIMLDTFQQTLARAGFGREWYLIGAAYEPGNRWRAGLDGGGLWGVANIDYHDFAPNPSLGPPKTQGQFFRKGHVAGGYFTALHTDFECPCNCCTFLAGFRTEFSFTTNRALVDRDMGIYWVNFLLNFGVRF